MSTAVRTTTLRSKISRTVALAALTGTVGLGVAGLATSPALAGNPAPTRVAAVAAAQSTPVNDRTMKPFEGRIQDGSTSWTISILGVITRTSGTGQQVIFQAKAINGTVLRAKVTYSQVASLPVGSYKNIDTNHPGFRPGPLATHFAGLVGNWDGHGRHLSVAANGQVKFSFRNYSVPVGDPAEQQTAEGFLRTNRDGSQSVTVYLTHTNRLAIAHTYPVSLKNGVLTVAGNTFCGAGAGAGTCGA